MLLAIARIAFLMCAFVFWCKMKRNVFYPLTIRTDDTRQEKKSSSKRVKERLFIMYFGDRYRRKGLTKVCVHFPMDLRIH